MTKVFSEDDMKNIVNELDIYLKTEFNDQVKKNRAELINVNKDRGTFVLSAKKGTQYEIYVRFNATYHTKDIFHKTMVIAVLAFREKSEVMESKVLKELIRIAQKYDCKYILYEALLDRMKTFAVQNGFSGYSTRLHPLEIDPFDTSFSTYVASVDKLSALL